MSTVGRATTRNPLFYLDQYGSNIGQNDRPVRDRCYLTVAEVDELTVAAKDNYRMTRDYRDHPHGLSRTTQEERLF